MDVVKAKVKGQDKPMRRRLRSCAFGFVSPFLVTASPVTCVAQLAFGLTAFVTTHLRSELWSHFDKGILLQWSWCPRRVYCIDQGSALQILLGILSRLCAGATYPVLALAFAMMAHSSMYWLQGRARVRVTGGLFLNVGGVRELHQRCGLVVGRLCFVHALAHVFRFTTRRQLKWACSQPMNIAGIVSVVAFALVPLAIGVARRSTLRYGVAMCLSHHALILIGICGAMAHGHRLKNFLIVAVLLWLLDKIYFVLMLSYDIESPSFTALKGGVLVTFPTPSGLRYHTGDYVKVCVPWLPKPYGREYHPFSIIPVGNDSHISMLYIQLAKRREGKSIGKSGSWSRELLDYVISRGSCGAARPMLVAGPYAAPFSTSLTHRYLLVVASGVGITPAMAVISRLRADRHIVLIWTARDSSLVRIFAEYIQDNRSRTILHLTGDAAEEDIQDIQQLDNVTIKRGRPDLQKLTTQILRDGDEFLVSKYDCDPKPRPSVFSNGANLPEQFCVNKPRHVSGSSSPRPYVATTHQLSRYFDDQPLSSHEWKVLYCGGSASIRDTIAKTCEKEGADFTSEIF